MDAARVAAVAALLLTEIAVPGCGGPKHEPAAPPTPPAAMTRVRTLRVGIPNRGNLLFDCNAEPAAPRIGSARYSLDSLDASRRTWLRLAEAETDSAGMLAPDTLNVRAFTDPTDEEIAIERGELDVAVFWPGELSARMRSDERFRDPELGLRARGVLACIPNADTLGAPRADMELLNREAFGGDLLPWSALGPGLGDGPATRYTVNETLPGAKHLERILGRIPSAGVTRWLSLVYLDQPVVGGDVTKSAQRLAGVTPLFAVRCPVLVAARSREDVRAIGADAFADLAPRAALHPDTSHGIYR